MADSLPLSGKTVLVTRPAQQAAGLIEKLQAAGATVLHQPAIKITAIPNPVLKQSPEHYDYIIFISQNAVQFGLENLPINPTTHASIAAIGQSTAKALNTAGFENIILPDQGFTSEDLLAMTDFAVENIDGQSILIVRGGAGRETLKQVLEHRGAKVDYVDVYQRQYAEPVITNQQLETVNFIMISSQQGLENLISLFGFNSIKNKSLVVPGERVRTFAEEKNFSTIHVAENATDDSMLKQLVAS